MGDGEIYDNNALIEIGLFFFFFVKNQCVDPPHLLPMKNCVAKSIECTRLFLTYCFYQTLPALLYMVSRM